METYNVWGVSIEIDNLKVNHDGEIEDWDLYIGGEEIISSADFLSKSVISELEKKVLARIHNEP